MKRDEAIEYLQNLIKEDQDLNATQKINAVDFAILTICSGALNYRMESNLKKYFAFLKGRMLKETK